MYSRHWTILFSVCILIEKSDLKIRSLCDFSFITPGIINEQLLYHDNPDLNFYYLWNKSAKSAIDYHQEVCADRCENGVKVNRNTFNLNVHCLDCDCKRPACELYGICCEDISSSPTSLIVSKVLSPASPTLYCDDASISNFPMLCIRSCPSGYDKEEVRRLCQEDVNVTQTTLDTFLRVVDVETEVVYYNLYCAICNNVSEPIHLRLNSSCSSLSLVYKAETPDELLRLLLLNRPECRVYQLWEFHFRPFECYMDQTFAYDLTSECDPNDPQKVMDADIVQACHETNGSKYQIYSFYDGQYYKNIFCYICGTMLYPFEMMDWWCFDSFVDGDMNLYRLLVNIHGRDQESSSKHSVCNDTFWPAPNGDCLQLRCSPGKTLKNGTCVTIFSEICGLVYRVRALLIPNVLSTTINYTTADIMDLAADQMSRRLKNISDGLKYQFGIATDKNVTATNHAVPVLWSDIYILASRQLTRDTFEKIALEIVFRDNAESDFIYINVINKDWFRFHGSDKDHLWLNNVNVDTERMMNSLTIGIENNILLSTVLLCTSITFHKSNYTVAWSGTNLEGNVTVTVDVGGSVTVTVDVGGTILTISNMSDMNSMEVTENEELHVCTEVLEKYVNELRKQKEKRPIVMAMNVLTYVCLCASELCLLFTLVTYLGFPELRTVPGINNMFLCLSLLLAQLALVLASNISAPSNLCTGVGLITHFLWLWHFTWSFLCSLHMFQVFTATVPTQSLNGSGKFILVVQLTTVSLVLPVTVVLAVIISSFVTSHTIGYGRLSCYLDTAYLIGLSVVAPICLVSLCCLTFLGITIASIHKVNKILSLASLEMDQYRNCLLYVKLSFVTGVYWIVTIIAEALDSDILWIISLLLNGLQGVAIFVSYMCNKRVYRLYLSKFLSQQTSSLQQTLSVQQTMTSE